jgi:hypothetical protein
MSLVTHNVRVKLAGVGTNGILEWESLSKTRTVPRPSSTEVGALTSRRESPPAEDIVVNVSLISEPPSAT